MLPLVPQIPSQVYNSYSAMGKNSAMSSSSRGRWNYNGSVWSEIIPLIRVEMKDPVYFQVILNGYLAGPRAVKAMPGSPLHINEPYSGPMKQNNSSLCITVLTSLSMGESQPAALTPAETKWRSRAATQKHSGPSLPRWKETEENAHVVFHNSIGPPLIKAAKNEDEMTLEV